MSSQHFGQRSTLRLDAFAWNPDALSSFEASYAPGDVVADRYQLESVLGAGGMGTVWRARDLMTSTSVAIKLATQGSGRSELAARMRTEAELEAQLRHPGVVRAFAFGVTQHGDAFIVMELLQGLSLRQLLAERGQLAPEEAIHMLLPIAEALCFVHASGVLHRDLKPENVMIAQTEHGTQPKIIDFGIAKRRSAAGWTREGVLVGSPGYMAPEQARTESDLDERVDIWAFCVVLYEVIAGTAALHPAETPTMHPHVTLTLDVRPSLEAVSGSEALLKVIERGLAQERQRRFQSMWDLTRALRASIRPQPRRRRAICYPLAA